MPGESHTGVPSAVLGQWELKVLHKLEGRVNRNWMVERLNGERFVLKQFTQPESDINYELSVLRRLSDSEWPVPTPVGEPLQAEGSTWCLFELLVGQPLEEKGASEQHSRGQLLARFHDSTFNLCDLGQRRGFKRCDAIVADFALSWRGEYDDVVRGYDEVHALSDLDRALLVPCFRAWMFLGVKDEIDKILSGHQENHGFKWQVKHLQKRSPLFGELSEPYPV
jgi:hypothetical protein